MHQLIGSLIMCYHAPDDIQHRLVDSHVSGNVKDRIVVQITVEHIEQTTLRDEVMKSTAEIGQIHGTQRVGGAAHVLFSEYING